MLLFLEQCLNGLQFGLLLFLLAAGLTLVFGIMDLVNLAHGSLYMVGAYFAATFVAWTGSFIAGALMALGATLIVGMIVEVVALAEPCVLESHVRFKPSKQHFLGDSRRQINGERSVFETLSPLPGSG